MKQTFSRYEEKYLLTKVEYLEMLEYLKKYCTLDAYCANDQTYKIYNIYYDTEDNNLIRHSIEKPKYKEKLRLRSYTFPLKKDDLVFLEIKKKIYGKVNKRRIGIDYKTALDYLAHHNKPIFDDYLSNQVLKELDYFLDKNIVKPNYVISYDRLALFTIDNSIRITFDSNIKSSKVNDNLDLQDENKILEDEIVLMEIKLKNNFPIWLVKKMSELSLYSRSFSKYGKAYERFILKEKACY